MERWLKKKTYLKHRLHASQYIILKEFFPVISLIHLNFYLYLLYLFQYFFFLNNSEWMNWKQRKINTQKQKAKKK